MRPVARARWIAVAFLVVGAAPGRTQETILTQIDQLRVGELEVAGFILREEGEVSIEAIGFDSRPSSAWILDAQTRDDVWSLTDAHSERHGRHLREYNDQVTLKAGRYEVYYATYPNGFDDFDWLGGDGFDSDDYHRAVRDFEIVVRGEGTALSETEVRDYHKSLTSGALLAVTGVEKNSYEKVGLTLDRDMDIQIYAVGELKRNESYDCSWIVDTRTREKVWEFAYVSSEPAGGAKKNRVFKDTISLPQGDYAVFVASDDSHDSGKWNAAPPYDPFFWGLTLQAADPAASRYAHVHEYEDLPEKNVVVRLTKLGDNDFLQEGFTLSHKTSLRIYAIGEGGRREMNDYSRIVNATTREVVWEMDGRKTEHAGGATKNRIFDSVIELEKGSYLVSAMTDDSHSYHDWNASPPNDRESWGITILAVGDGMKHVTAYEDDHDGGVLARLTGVGDDASETERFALKTPTRVAIYALGEGRSGRMYDYAWIEDAESGRVVWEMSYRMTRHAGGAKKNRVYDDVIELSPGEYVVYYKTDDSHSFRHWNDSPPPDALSWGVTIRLADAN